MSETKGGSINEAAAGVWLTRPSYTLPKKKGDVKWNKLQGKHSLLLAVCVCVYRVRAFEMIRAGPADWLWPAVGSETHVCASASLSDKMPPLTRQRGCLHTAATVSQYYKHHMWSFSTSRFVSHGGGTHEHVFMCGLHKAGLCIRVTYSHVSITAEDIALTYIHFLDTNQSLHPEGQFILLRRAYADAVCPFSVRQYSI